MITVHVRLFATLRRYLPDLELGEAADVRLPDGATVGQLIDQLGLSTDEVKVVFVDGVVRQPKDLLSEGDEVGVFPPVGGG